MRGGALHEHLVFRDRLAQISMVVQKALIEFDLPAFADFRFQDQVGDQFVAGKPEVIFIGGGTAGIAAGGWAAGVWSLGAGAAGAGVDGAGVAAAGGIALVNAMGNVGGFAGPFLVGWIRDTTGSFVNALLMLAAVMAMSALMLLLGGRRLSPGWVSPEVQEPETGAYRPMV